MNTELSESQRASILKQLKGAPRMPTELVAGTEGLSEYNPHCGESVRRYLAELEKNGHIEQVKNERGRLIGWQQKPDDKKE